MIVEWKNSSKQNKLGQLTKKMYTFERVKNFKYLGVTLNEFNKHKIDVQERIKKANKTYLILQKFFRNKNIFAYKWLLFTTYNKRENIY